MDDTTENYTTRRDVTLDRAGPGSGAASDAALDNRSISTSPGPSPQRTFIATLAPTVRRGPMIRAPAIAAPVTRTCHPHRPAMP
jgi:hypothetical protein